MIELTKEAAQLILLYIEMQSVYLTDDNAYEMYEENPEMETVIEPILHRLSTFVKA